MEEEQVVKNEVSVSFQLGEVGCKDVRSINIDGVVFDQEKYTLLVKMVNDFVHSFSSAVVQPLPAPNVALAAPEAIAENVSDDSGMSGRGLSMHTQEGPERE